jgi:uncharacterized BrkB/YihY/UPF0761 family membrane protein
MYLALLHTHNFTRWLVLLAALVALVMAVMALAGRKPYEKRHRLANLSFVISMDLQLVLGLLLYVVSPLVQSALADIGNAMGNSELRFFAVEHMSVMLVAVALAHVGSVLIRRAPSDHAKHARAVLWFGLSTTAVIFSIPWWRPLFPGA